MSAARALTSEMPDWVKKQIEMQDVVSLSAAAGRHLGRQAYRITVDGDAHNFNYRTDVFSDAGTGRGLESR